MRVKSLLISIFLFLSAFPLAAQAEKPRVEMDTSMGTIIVELEPYRAPATVDNFLKYVKARFYDGTVFHRIEENFVIQGGGYDLHYQYKDTRPAIKNESNNGLDNKRGTIAMARTDDVDSATSQFYINVDNNRALDAVYGRLGYTVFGHVIEGMEAVDAISHVKVGVVPNVGETVPINPVVIRSIRMYTAKPADANPAEKPVNTKQSDKNQEDKS